MARTTVLGQSGTGKSYFGGKVLEDVLTDGDGSGRAHGCGCGEEDCEHTHGDEEFVPRIHTGEGAPDFDADEDFEYAIHIDIEDEEAGFSDPEDPVLLTYEPDEEDVASYVHYNAGNVPDWIPEKERESDGSATVYGPAWVFYRNKYIRVVPDGLTDDELDVLVEMLADAAMKAEDTHFSVDEAHLVARKHGVGKKLMRLITGGRKRGVEWLFITQRPQRLHEDILSQSDYSVYFKLLDRDRDKAAEKSEAIPNAEHKIEALEKREAIIENFLDGEWHQFDANGIERKIPHYAGDDGKANHVYEGMMGEDPDDYAEARDDSDAEDETTS